MTTVEALENKLSEPSTPLIEDLRRPEGDILVLGAGGKMGPSLAKLAKRAVDAGGSQKRIIGVSRFSNEALKSELEDFGVEVIAGDLMDESFLEKLPDVENIIYMAGNKFGTTGREHFTWAMNAYLPGRIAKKYKNSRIVVFSTGNVYPLTRSGATEEDHANPIGEYAQSCLGRERVFEYFSHKYHTPMAIYRLNYAIDLRYGVLLEIAKSVWEENPIDLQMGNVNVIWQGDANEIALRSLNHCTSPPNILNVTGPEILSIRTLAKEFGKIMGKTPVFLNEPQPTALLSKTDKANQLFGRPRVTVEEMITWTADWVKAGGSELGKPTHFQERSGKF
ncbi:NAD-dependent epimerase/dehydratase family protein [Fulvivirgaceae bacterium BMA12]|uniref:NAD-dependent epimerase/dehydratase family protein n=1 Tax=Agaribacillus aureus TaxID=3051825 RepID=A0ABT8L253_9BACT|nr:NAD-dependent epimerase/dehydratase family protein [Fulvivirgaceae bacterium BMA12]